jgi:CsoR family transcriptional regulator, copper-sensing transcriptional repressor
MKERKMQAENKADALKRLNYIEGHLDGIRRMVEGEQYCIDILKQTYAVRKAIEKLEGMLLEGHLESCVPTAIAENRAEQVIKEMVELYAMSNK